MVVKKKKSKIKTLYITTQLFVDVWVLVVWPALLRLALSSVVDACAVLLGTAYVETCLRTL